jgi:L-2-hydroxyglutarate oxidase LhgO
VLTGRIAVVGGGIVGLATARVLRDSNPGAEVVVLEKEPEVGRHQTSHNSGVVHAGVYYPPGSEKARLCRRGRRLLAEFCAETEIAYEECGKVIVARDEAELAPLAGIEARARANKVPGLRRLDRAGLRRIEPHAAGVAALHSPHTAITDFAAVAAALASGLDVRTTVTVTAVRPRPGGLTVQTAGPRGPLDLEVDGAVICAGLHSDTLARLAGYAGPVTILPFRGEYWRLRPERDHLVSGLIYPVPDPRYPFLGVHFTRRVGGGVDVGPNAVPGLAPEAYHRGDVNLRWLARIASNPAVWRLARRHWRTGLHELAGSASKRVFVRRAATLLPGLTPDDVVPAPAGVRAQAVDRSGNLLDDFRISRLGPGGRVVAVLNAPSPAATSCLALAERICDELGRPSRPT